MVHELLNGQVMKLLTIASYFLIAALAVAEGLLVNNLGVDKAFNREVKQEGDAELQRALSHYQLLAARGGWPRVPPGPKMSRGYRDPRNIILRQRLTISGDLQALSPEADLMDETLEQAVRRFQVRHGLHVDGIVGPDTLKELNVPITERLHQIEGNLRRRRYLPPDLGSRYIIINIPAFDLKVVEEGRVLISVRVVVGKSGSPTPTFTDELDSVVLNPHWTVPSEIVRELLPLIGNDADYLKRKNFRVLQAGSPPREIDPDTIDWSEMTAEAFSYRLVQKPGPMNSLGRLRFSFLKQRTIHLHDTPQRELFQRNARAFSHGCIRIEKPVELALYVLGPNTPWTAERILESIKKGSEQKIPLPQRIPVRVVYWTAWVDPQETVHFRRDIYKWDQNHLITHQAPAE